MIAVARGAGARGWFAIGVPVALLAVLAGCAFEENEQGVVPPPLVLRWTFPADSTESQYRQEGADLIMRFNRLPEADELRLNRIVPAPVEPGTFRLGTEGSREVLWTGVVFDPDVLKYTWWIDGPELVEPAILVLYTGLRGREQGLVTGRITIGRPFTDVPRGILYVLDDDPEAAFVNERTDFVLGLPVFTMVPIGGEDDGDRETTFLVENLTVGDSYLLLAVVDTNGDRDYFPGTDWWGYPRAVDVPDEPLFVTAGMVREAQPASFEVVRPGALVPPGF